MNPTELLPKTKRITLCGSTKFKKEFEAINRQLTLEGNVVYTVAFFGHADSVPLTPEQKETLDAVHLKKIDNSDAVFVVDVDGYIGESTRKEINYAELQGKTVKYLSRFPDLKMLCDSVTLSLATTAAPPNAEDAEFGLNGKPWHELSPDEMLKCLESGFVRGKEDWNLQDLTKWRESYASHTAAKAVEDTRKVIVSDAVKAAVEDERQRLVRLVDERIVYAESKIKEAQESRLNRWAAEWICVYDELMKVRQWLAGDVGEKG